MSVRQDSDHFCVNYSHTDRLKTREGMFSKITEVMPKLVRYRLVARKMVKKAWPSNHTFEYKAL
jgi:hypothetical protein